MNIDYKKTILRTSLWTLLILFVLSVMLWLVMFFIFPKTLGDFCYSLGAENMAANLYYKDYERTNDIISVYKSLNIEIKLRDNDKIIKYYVEFTEDEEYSEFIELYKVRNEQLNIGILEKSTMLNEDNYLSNHYISALISTGQTNKAFNLAIGLFKNYNEFTLTEQGVYAFKHFIESQDFDRVPEGYSKSLKLSIQEYFENCVNLFNTKIDTTDVIEKAYLMALGNRIIEVGQNINTLHLTSEDTLQVESNTMLMTEINTKIKGLL